MHVRHAVPSDREAWVRMRLALWPTESADDLAHDVDEFLAGNETQLSVVFVAVDGRGAPIGFLEVFIRNVAEGCTGSAPYLEGWYVEPNARRTGVGRALVHAAEEWSRQRGFHEIASDTWLDNDASHRAHEALGFEEVERIVHYRKAL